MRFGLNGAVITAALAIASTALSGCVQTPESASGDGTAGLGIIAESRADPAAPVSFRERASVRRCDDIVLDQGEVPADPTKRCLEDAYISDGGELAIARPTIEGDWIVAHYLVVPGAESLQIYYDTSRDRFGGQDWQEIECFLPDGANSIADCIK